MFTGRRLAQYRGDHNVNFQLSALRSWFVACVHASRLICHSRHTLGVLSPILGQAPVKASKRTLPKCKRSAVPFPVPGNRHSKAPESNQVFNLTIQSRILLQRIALQQAPWPARMAPRTEGTKRRSVLDNMPLEAQSAFCHSTHQQRCSYTAHTSTGSSSSTALQRASLAIHRHACLQLINSHNRALQLVL